MCDPREIFPEEVWVLILKCVDDPQDIQSCYKTCTLFRNHLSSTRTTWAFALILPSLTKLLPRDDVLQCRLISKQWLKSVDKFLQSDIIPNRGLEFQGTGGNVPAGYNLAEYIDLQEPDYVQSLSPLENLLAQGTKNLPNVIGFRHFDGTGGGLGQGRDLAYGVPISLIPNQIQGPAREVRHRDQVEFLEFLSSFKNNPEMNPFPSKAVVLIVTNRTFQSVILLLNRYGEYIWSLKLYLELSGMSSFHELQLIWTILTLVPNLKHLLIEDTGSLLSLPFSRDLDILNAFWDKATTPVLKQLKWLELDIKSEIIQSVLVKAYHNRSVTIFERKGSIKPTHLTSDSWRQLNLQFDRKTVWRAHIRSFKFLNLPLESINIQCFQCKDFGSIFDSLSKYGSTLRRLKLTFTDLKNEEFISMKKDVYTIYISFLSQMKCLENFNMIIDCDSAGRSIEFRQFVDAILDMVQIEQYLIMGGVISGFRRFGFACISAGLKMKANGQCRLKRKYFTDGKYFRSMDMIPCEKY